MTEPFLIRPEILDGDRRRRAVEGLRAAQVTLPSWSELADPARIPAAIVSSLKSVGPDEPDAKNLWRVTGSTTLVAAIECLCPAMWFCPRR